MQSTATNLVTSHTHNGNTLSLQQTYANIGVEQTCCSHYIDDIGAVAVGEYDNKNKQNRPAAVTLTDIRSGRDCT